MKFLTLVLLLLLTAVIIRLSYDGNSYLDKIDLQDLFDQKLSLIDDQSNLLSVDDENYINEYHQVLLQRYDLDYRIVTANDISDIDEYSRQLFNDELIGEQSRQGRGLLLVIDPVKDVLRIEVSAQLESVFPDAFIAYIEQRQMVPYFKLGRVDEGIFATSELIRIRLIDAMKGGEFDPDSLKMSIGGGASSKGNIASGRDNTFVEGRSDILAAEQPVETLRRFFEAMENRNGRWDLDIFTAGSKLHMKGKVSTPAQMDNAVKRYKNCQMEHLFYDSSRSLAVWMPKLQDRSCDPFLFEKGYDGKWRIDLKAMGDGLGHTVGNIWYLDFSRQNQSGIAKYLFGFEHLYIYRPEGERFDHQGIPFYKPFGMKYGYSGYEGTVIKRFVGLDSYLKNQGLMVGDVILQWESNKNPHSNVVDRRMQIVRPGLDIFLKIRRGNMYFDKFIKAPPYPDPGKYRFGVTFFSRGKHQVKIFHIEPDSQADRMGLKKNDLITHWNEKNNPSINFIDDELYNLKSDDEISIQVLRGDFYMNFNAKVEPKREMSQVH
ncbi:TPM domain-containing protein [Aliamphritea ceti]|uniref:TPM domain-containing protein n=1 Tax=Aliamphritea ceti TaxID=1524258 RepID=UPI0021C3BFE5|nr:TPM domain-containing protein [Aliamphritea ceti]